ncbi:hypothetical protein OIU84_002785 [Salix udensis]|uniref:Calponin-homology (CH) domain-containing protein n=1 Tax=Salix udensis TaxID=889485 RepID=A0AAD6P5S1_9ROSI|nr:hypothetical protein OIU84_002785 [Salix udensis]
MECCYGIIDERVVSTKRVLNPWERNGNHTLCLNSAKAIGCTVVNIGTQHLVERRPHLLLGLISLIIKNGKKLESVVVSDSCPLKFLKLLSIPLLQLALQHNARKFVCLFETDSVFSGHVSFSSRMAGKLITAHTKENVVKKQALTYDENVRR